MLEGLDQVNWNGMEHAYGPAADVPDLIRALASPDVEKRNEAMHWLYGTIWHQGTVYEATAYAVPFLIELLQEPEVQDKDAILSLLAHLANGSSYLDVHQDFYPERDEQGTPEFDEQLQREVSWVRAAHEAVERGVNLYLDLARDARPAVRMAAVYLVASFTERGARTTPVLLAQMERETDARVRACILLTLGALGEHGPGARERFEQMIASDAPELLRVAAAMGMVWAEREHAPEAAVRLLVAALAYPQDENMEQYADLPWARSTLAGDICNTLAWLGPRAGRDAVPLLARALLDPAIAASGKAAERPDVNTITFTMTPADGDESKAVRGAITNVPEAYPALNILRALLTLAFAGDEREATDGQGAPEPQALSDEQRTALKAIVESDSVWELSMNAAEILRAFHLPDSRDGLRALEAAQGN
ncbi:MAG: hypothetical protein OJF49_004101 [Ktedonobacterales bacterium]|jgi:hypothetical protein|nr:MAG: hypothetical protein OJF49_004101 [Ktedonobacterales bacterium]